ncbi:VWA domain-containing protein [Pseudophaeobacter sp. EL27]|uniref:vWA domain-containing protein n=1 Tax=Pseudophaeobacter sp. EL27 TaxID=2107580 RepID=UPI000EFAEA01|nr:VWA domain-containing protein [Pseudophaeobacter sp. EL27]
MADLFGVFHFLRPLWLLTLVPLALIWWRIRWQKTRDDPLSEGIAPHLARALTVGLHEGRKVYPIDGVALTLGLLVLAAAGPTWSRVANPLLAQTAPLAVVLKITPSMKNIDVPPTRLKRASFKILDLIERRAGAQTALIAYSGSAHRVTPLTEDPNILKSYLSGLAPDMMPVSGDRADQALELAKVELEGSETPGAILFVLDDLSPGNVNALNASAANRPPVIFFVVGAAAGQLPQIERIENSTVVNFSPDDTDLNRIERAVLSAYREALLEDVRQDWEDKGWILAWAALLLFLPWFRRGWTMRLTLATWLLTSQNTPAQAQDWRDWFLTRDQQGQIAMQNKDFSRATDLFQDPAQRAFALLRAGRYEETAEAYGFIETAAAANGEGVALLRNREYRAGVRAFEKALERDPDHTAAAANLEVARAIVDYVENAQLASDTGEETGIGADEIVYDNESGQGDDMLVEQDAPDGPAQGLSTEDWMRAVDTQVGDFLATRFLLENSRRSE